MARGTVVLEAVVCASCGAKVREDRVRCLRCGKPLVAAHVDRARYPVPQTKILVAVSVLAAIGLAGVVVTRPASAPPPALAATIAVVARPTPRVAEAAASTPAPVSVALDAKRAGNTAYDQGNVGSALEQFRKAVDAHPDDHDALNKLGQALVRAGQAREAIQYFDRAIVASPDTWAYQFNRARAYAELKEWAQAVAGYRDALRLFPDDYATQFNLAKALHANGDLPAALQGFERAIELAPGQADFHLSHGLALEAAERPRDAVGAYKRYLELAENGPETDKVKGRISLLEGSR